MWKEKVTRLFNANNITIEKVEKSVSRNIVPTGCAIKILSVTGGPHRDGAGNSNNHFKTVTREIIKESPLGFYYKQTKTEKIDIDTGKKPIERHWYEIVFNHNDTYYRLKFPIKVGENVVSRKEDGLRPWEVSENDHALSDQMLKALQKQVSIYFDLIDQYKIKFVSKKINPDKRCWMDGYYYWEETSEQIQQIKNEVYEYLYGNKNGLRVMTDEQKILAHGFDLKTSFRKDKENK